MFSKLKSHHQILLAMFFGYIIGYSFEFSKIFIPLGDIFIRLLKMIIVPIIFTSIVSGVSSVSKSQNIRSLGLKTILYYMSTSLMAIVIGLFLANTIKPGVGFSVDSSSIKAKELLEAPAGILDMIYRIIPLNPIESLAKGDILSIIFFSILFGYSITRIPSDYKDRLNSFITALHETIMYLTGMIIKLAPIGVFGLIIKAVHHSSSNIIPSIGLYMLTILIGLAFHLLVILPAIFWFFTRISPIMHYKAMSKAMLTAFSTSSSSATLPVTMNCIRENVKVSKTTSSFVLPLGSTINMDGTALYECAGVLFISQAIGIELGVLEQLTVVFTALLASIGAAGIPSAGLVMIFIVLKSVGLSEHPQVGILVGTMLAVDRPLDMLRTMVNVTSDSVGAAIIGKSEGDRLYED
jgi:Na+/H+-dicarboxylate symporter